jgi:hypothetical protein
VQALQADRLQVPVHRGIQPLNVSKSKQEVFTVRDKFTVFAVAGRDHRPNYRSLGISPA